MDSVLLVELLYVIYYGVVLLGHVFQHFLIIICPLTDWKLSYFELIIVCNTPVAIYVCTFTILLKFYPTLKTFVPWFHRYWLLACHHCAEICYYVMWIIRRYRC